MEKNQSERYLKVQQVAAMLNVSKGTVWRWAKAGQLAQPVKLTPGSTRWRLSDIQAFADGEVA